MGAAGHVRDLPVGRLGVAAVGGRGGGVAPVAAGQVGGGGAEADPGGQLVAGG